VASSFLIHQLPDGFLVFITYFLRPAFQHFRSTMEAENVASACDESFFFATFFLLVQFMDEAFTASPQDY